MKVVYTMVEVVEEKRKEDTIPMEEGRSSVLLESVHSVVWSLLHELLDEAFAHLFGLFWFGEESGDLLGDIIAQWSWQESRVLLALLGQLDRVIRGESESIMHFLLLDVFRGNLLLFVELWELLEEWPELVMTLLAWLVAAGWVVDDHFACEWRRLLVLQLELLGPQDQVVDEDVTVQADEDATFWQVSWLTSDKRRVWHRYSSLLHEMIDGVLND